MNANASVVAEIEIDYPCSDGKPMGETDFHVIEMMAALGTLKDFFRDAPDVYVAANNFVYYEKGEPSAVFSPDVYVVFGVPKRKRRIYKIWDENFIPPTVVFEFTSRKTRLEDKGSKKAVCAELGVAEYFLCDPEMDYLKPPLQGFRLDGDVYHPIPASDGGFLFSRAMGLRLRQDEHGLLRFYRGRAGEPLLRVEEVFEQHRQVDELLHEANVKVIEATEKAIEANEKAIEANEKAVEAERLRNLAEETARSERARSAALEAELARLKAGLDRSH